MATAVVDPAMPNAELSCAEEDAESRERVDVPVRPGSSGVSSEIKIETSHSPFPLFFKCLGDLLNTSLLI